MSKNYLAYTFLTLAALFWSGNFIIGKYATLFEVPPLTLNFFRWVMVWFILIPFTIKEILAKKKYIKENFLVISVMGILTISTFNSVVYFALNFTQFLIGALWVSQVVRADSGQLPSWGRNVGNAQAYGSAAVLLAFYFGAIGEALFVPALVLFGIVLYPLFIFGLFKAFSEQ